MRHVIVDAIIPGIDKDGIARQRLHCYRGDKFCTRFSHDYLNVDARFFQQARQLCGFVGSNAAGDPQHHANRFLCSFSSHFSILHRIIPAHGNHRVA